MFMSFVSLDVVPVTVLMQIVATFLYAAIGCAGYLMFGRSVSSEVGHVNNHRRFSLLTGASD